jgi:hypothetical protein
MFYFSFSNNIARICVRWTPVRDDVAMVNSVQNCDSSGTCVFELSFY